MNALSGANHCFSNVTMCKCHLKTLLKYNTLVPFPPDVLIQKIKEGAMNLHV